MQSSGEVSEHGLRRGAAARQREVEPSAPRFREARHGIIGLIALLSIAWMVAALTTGLGAYRDLDSAREDVVAAEQQLRAAELSDARESLSSGVARAASASTALRRPWVTPLRVLPIAGPNLRAATVLSDTARDNGTAAAAFLDVAAIIVSDDRNQDLGEISLTYLSELAPPARSLADTLDHTAEEVAGLDPERLIGPVRRAREQFLGLVEPNLDEVMLAADLLEVMPAFLGEDETRTYLVGAAALSEIRASGGLLGSWTVLTAEQGRLTFQDFVDSDTLPFAEEDVESPSDDYLRRYADLGALRQHRNANLTPDFPSAAHVLMGLWVAGGGTPVDGIIMVDPLVYERLSERSGGFEVAGHGWLAPADTLQFLAVDAYDVFRDDDERKRVLGATATAAFAEMFEILEDADVPATVEMLRALAAGGHLRINTTDAEVQGVMRRAGVAGELPATGGESVGFFTNNIAGNKIDWFEQRRIDHLVRLHPEGVTRSEVTIDVHNGAPLHGHRRGVLGPWTDLTEVGDNLLLTTFTCSTTCKVTSTPAGSEDGGTELGRPMYDATVLLPSGDSHRMRFGTESDAAWEWVDGTLVLEVEHLVQPTLHGVEFTLRVDVPTGLALLRGPEGAEVREGQVIWTQIASGRLDAQFVFEGSGSEIEGA